jgi:proteasome lid subunit RPN8/RPN11
MLLINNNIFRGIINIAKNISEECCGFLLGYQTSSVRTITYILNVNNSSKQDKRYRFEINAKDYILAEELADKNDLQLLGVYHSHLNAPATPSETDRRNALPCFSYVIFSMQGGQFSEIRSWQLNDELQFREEILKIEPQ